MPESDFFTTGSAAAAVLAGKVPPLFTHSSTVLKAVNFLVLP